MPLGRNKICRKKYPCREGCIFLFNFQSASLVFLQFVFFLSIEEQVDTRLCDRLQGKPGDPADREHPVLSLWGDSSLGNRPLLDPSRCLYLP